jgi:hypothetical protein
VNVKVLFELSASVSALELGIISQHKLLLARVGDGLGDELGVALGNPVGVALGVALGEALGDPLGVALGVALGVGVPSLAESPNG